MCLDFCLSWKGSIAVSDARATAAGLQLRATDLAWAWGNGRDVVGPAERLLMAINGRAGATVELTGSGASTLTSRSRRSPH